MNVYGFLSSFLPYTHRLRRRYAKTGVGEYFFQKNFSGAGKPCAGPDIMGLCHFAGQLFKPVRIAEPIGFRPFGPQYACAPEVTEQPAQMAGRDAEAPCCGPALHVHPALNGVFQQIGGQAVPGRIQQRARAGRGCVVESAHEVAAHEPVKVEALHVSAKRARRH